MENKKHLDYLNKLILSKIKKAQKEILDNTECAIEGQDRWLAVRSRILGATNNAVREIQNELQRNWEVKHNPQIIHEDVVEINRPVKEKENTDKDGNKKPEDH